MSEIGDTISTRGAGAVGCAAVTLSVLALAACGSSVVRSGSSAGRTDTSKEADSAPSPQGRGDRDFDKGRGSYYDRDDAAVVGFGRAISHAERQQIGLLLARYYADAAAGDGAAGCSLLYSLFVESVVEDHGEPSSQASGRSCGAILSKLFKKSHRQLANESSRLRVLDARVEGPRGYVLIDTGLGYPLMMYLRSESGLWKLESLQAAELG